MGEVVVVWGGGVCVGVGGGGGTVRLFYFL